MPAVTAPNTPTKHIKPYSRASDEQRFPPTPHSNVSQRSRSYKGKYVDSPTPAPVGDDLIFSSSDDDDDGSVYSPPTPLKSITNEDIEIMELDASDEDIKPTITAATKARASKKSEAKPKVRQYNGGKAAPRAWSADEDWHMFRLLHPKIDKPEWAKIAGSVGNGRDAKSCQNRYATLSKKLEGAIKGVGGA